MPQIPLLVIVVCAMLYSSFPGLFSAAWNLVPTFDVTANAIGDRPVEEIA